MHGQQFKINIEESIIRCLFGENVSHLGLILNFVWILKVLVTIVLVSDQNAPLSFKEHPYSLLLISIMVWVGILAD